MAKNQDRQFSEGENLLPKDLGQSPYETEERLPSWAVKPAEEAAPEKEAPPAGESPDEIRRPLFAAPKAEQADDEPQQAPQRVESAQERRFRDVQEKNEEKNSKNLLYAASNQHTVKRRGIHYGNDTQMVRFQIRHCHTAADQADPRRDRRHHDTL